MNKILCICALVCFGAASLAVAADDLSGTWTFSVDLENGGHGDPTFVLKQANGKLTGTYSGPMGERQVTGTVNGNQAVFSFEFEQDGSKVNATYTATMDGPGKMHGTLQFKGAEGGGTTGKWTATKK